MAYRPTNLIPTSVTLTNTLDTDLYLGGYLKLAASAASVVIDMTKYSDAGGARSIRQKVWNAIAQQVLKTNVTKVTSTPAVTINTANDGLEVGVVTTDSNVARPGLPGYIADRQGPHIASAVMAASCDTVTVTFSEAVYSTANGSGALAPADFSVSIAGGTATAVAVLAATKANGTALEGGETVVLLRLSYTGALDAAETVSVAVAATSIYDARGNPAPTLTATAIDVPDDSTIPALSTAVGNATNTRVTLTFSEGVYAVGGTKVEIGDLNAVFAANGGTATAAAISAPTNVDGGALVGGENVIVVTLAVTGTVAGTETVTINAVAASVRDASGNVAVAGTTKVVTLLVQA